MVRDNTTDLIALLAVTEERSFTKAAAKLGVSQAALSHTIRGPQAWEFAAFRPFWAWSFLFSRGLFPWPYRRAAMSKRHRALDRTGEAAGTRSRSDRCAEFTQIIAGLEEFVTLADCDP